MIAHSESLQNFITAARLCNEQGDFTNERVFLMLADRVRANMSDDDNVVWL